MWSSCLEVGKWWHCWCCCFDMALAAKNALGPMPPGGLHHWREDTHPAQALSKATCSSSSLSKTITSASCIAGMLHASLQHTARYFSRSSSCFKVACITGEKPLTLYKPSRVLCAPHREVIPFPVNVNRRVDVFDDKAQWIHALRGLDHWREANHLARAVASACAVQLLLCRPCKLISYTTATGYVCQLATATISSS
eukprot:scpid70798/ scgid2896/ 